MEFPTKILNILSKNVQRKCRINFKYIPGEIHKGMAKTVHKNAEEFPLKITETIH